MNENISYFLQDASILGRGNDEALLAGMWQRWQSLLETHGHNESFAKGALSKHAISFSVDPNKIGDIVSRVKSAKEQSRRVTPGYISC